jgi:hypothetical protein
MITLYPELAALTPEQDADLKLYYACIAELMRGEAFVDLDILRLMLMGEM